jgi:hypothetical protein
VEGTALIAGLRGVVRAFAGAIIATMILSACSSKSQATDTPAPSTAAPQATALLSTPTALPTSTPIPSTPTALPTSAPVLATTTALSATSTAFVSTITAGTPTVAAPTSPPSDPKAQAIVDAARTRLDQVNSVHFALTVDGDLFIDPARTQKVRSAEGDLVRPDKVSASAKIAAGPINATVKFIQIGDDVYMTNLLNGKWEKAPGGLGYDPRVVFDSQNGVTAILKNVSGWQFVENTKVNGVDTQHVRGPVPVQAVNGLVANSMRGDAVDVDLYVEGKNHDIVRLVIAEQPAAVTPGTVASRWTLDLSNQNGNISIVPPI